MEEEKTSGEGIAIAILSIVMLTSFVGAVIGDSISSAIVFASIVISESIDGFRKVR